MNFIEKNLKDVDSQFYQLLLKERERQKNKLILNAAISICPKSVLQVQNSCFVNIDAEGYAPQYLSKQLESQLLNFDKQLELYEALKDSRANKNCEIANIADVLAQKRLAKVFANDCVNQEEIFVNFYPPTGSIANLIILNALLEPKDKILSLELSQGAHLSHGAKIHFSGKNYEIINYHINSKTNNLDYDEIDLQLKLHTPQMLIAGFSSFPLQIDWLRLKDGIKKYSPSTLLFADIAHTAGLVAGGVFNNPVGVADVVSLVTYKTFCGPRAAAILTTNVKINDKIKKSAFPGIMGAPLLIGAIGIGVSAKIAQTQEFVILQKNIVNNARLLCKYLTKEGVPLAFKTTDTHIVIINAYQFLKMEKSGQVLADTLEDCNIMVNKQMLINDEKNSDSKGIRIGTTWITQLNITEQDIALIAKIIKGIMIAIKDNNKDLSCFKIQINGLTNKLNANLSYWQ